MFAAHPGIIKNPHSIKELTYREMRELAYAGFSVLHDEALLPAYRGRIPLVIKTPITQLTLVPELYTNIPSKQFLLSVLLQTMVLSALTCPNT